MRSFLPEDLFSVMICTNVKASMLQHLKTLFFRFQERGGRLVEKKLLHLEEVFFFWFLADLNGV